MLTGVAPMYDVCSDKLAAKLIKKGAVPFIHGLWEQRSFAERQLVSIIEDCLEYEVDERLSIQELIERLRWAVGENRRRDEM